MAANTTLVLGGTGKVGGRVVERLRSRGMQVRVGSRSAVPAFDWENPAGWPAALREVSSVFISYYPDLAAPGATDSIRKLTQAAVASGVKRLVLLSGRGEHEAQLCEEIVKASGLEWTLVRASWFSQNFSEGYLVQSILDGEVALPAKNIGEPFVDTDDIADVALAALTEDKHVGQLYEVTGPRLLTFAQAVEEIARACKRDIRYIEVPMEQYAAVLAQADLPPGLAELITYLFSEVLDGRNAHLSDGVMRALGRAPRDFAVYARKAATLGVWDK
jgi:uncharacterized protein YbjT (DUF2867 family)